MTGTTDSIPLPDLRVSSYRIVLQAVDTLSLPPYIANTLRGGFGAALKRLVCIYYPPRPCEPCLLRYTCAYGVLFESAPPPDARVLRKNAAVPRPFVLEPPLRGPTHRRAGDRIEIGLVLIGRAIEFLPHFLLAFQKLGDSGLGIGRGRFVVATMAAVHPATGEDTQIYRDGDLTFTERDVLLDVKQLAAAFPFESQLGAVTLRFLTPTRLFRDGHLQPNPEFSDLIRALLRRVSSLAYFHGGGRWNLDFKQVKERAKSVSIRRSNLRWWDWGRYSARQQVQMKLGGVVGDVTYEGPVADFLPLLLLGSVIHVGTACTFGHGRYQLAD